MSLNKTPFGTVFFVTCAMLAAFPAHASTIGAIGSPKVKAGETALETRFGYSEADEDSSDDERLRARVHVDHGFNDLYAARIIAAGDKRKDNNFETDSLTFENRFYLLKAEQNGFDFGVRAGYMLKDGDKKPDSITAGMYELVPFEGGEFRANQLFDRDVGEDADKGIGAELRFQLVGNIAQNHSLGAESYHDFGKLNELSGYSDQSHTFGPVLKGKLCDGLKYETGYRVGISKAAPDHSVKFYLAHSF